MGFRFLRVAWCGSGRAGRRIIGEIHSRRMKRGRWGLAGRHQGRCVLGEGHGGWSTHIPGGPPSASSISLRFRDFG